jgi:hypothetical protein
MTWPLVKVMSDTIVGQVGDNIYFIWMIGWIKRAIFDLHVNPFDVWFLNYPEGWNMAYTEITPIQLLIALPFSFINGPTFAYNATMMLTFVLAGLAMYLWIHYLTGKGSAGLIAGTAYAFIPYHFAHFLIGHLNLSGIQWFPLYFWGYFELLHRMRFPGSGALRKPAILAGISLGLIGWTGQYYLYMTLIVSAFIFFCSLFVQQTDGDGIKFNDRLRTAWYRLWSCSTIKGMGFMAASAAPLVLVAVAPYVTLLGQGGLPNRDMGIVRMYSAGLTDFLLPSTDHFLWGKWVGTNFNRQMWVEGTLYLGLITTVLAIVAWIKRKQLGLVWVLKLMLCGSLLALILAMGTDLHWNGEAIELTLPAQLAALIDRSQLPIILPGYFLFKYFPLYAKLRALMRFGFFVLLFGCAMAGLGGAWLIEKVSKKRKWVLTGFLVVLILFDFYPGPYQELAKIQARPVDSWLSTQPGSGAVIQFPFSLAEDQEMTYYTLTHGKPYVGGFFNAFPPAQYSRIRPLLANFPDRQSVDLSRQLGVEYLLVDKASYVDSTKLVSECQALGLDLVQDLAGQLVFVFAD